MFIHPQIDRELEEFADHVLTCLVDANGISVYEARKPGTMINSFTVAFLPNHICITGDYCPGIHGVTSAHGYGRGWFAGKLGADYLAEKFLQKGWYSDNARQWLIEQAECYPEVAEGLLAMADRDELLSDLSRFTEEFDELVPGTDWDCSPWGYNPLEVFQLAVCQRVFSRLFNEVAHG